MNDEQRFLFDTFGFLIVPNVLTTVQLDQLTSTIARPTEQWDHNDRGPEKGPLHWDPIWRELLDLPVISALLEDMIGDPLLQAAAQRNPNQTGLPTFRLDHINIHTHIKKGFAGGKLHGGHGVNGAFRYHDGRFYNGMTTVSFELYDTHPNDGGFCCVPGTHKGNVPMPSDWLDLSVDVAPCVQRVSARPGDAIIFTEALTHGTLPWTADTPRASIFYKFSPHSASWGADFYAPDDYRIYDDMDDRRLAMLEPPNARYRGRPHRPARRDDGVSAETDS
jgi:hypothetical protein